LKPSNGAAFKGVVQISSCTTPPYLHYLLTLPTSCTNSAVQPPPSARNAPPTLWF